VPGPVAFGKYLLVRPLAKGGMATVHLAILPGAQGFEKELVVKQILPELASDERFVDLFVSEAKNAVSLRHGNIVPVYELGVVDGVYFIAMERVHGRTLAEVLDAGVRLSPEAAVHVAVEVLRALAHAHGRSPPLVHRDLSSRNVMLTYDGEVKVLDFGIAGPAGVHREGAPLGSLGYLAPEQLRGEPADRRSDLFAVGILLCEMLTGEPLFGREDTDEARAEVLRGTSPAPSAISSSPPALDDPVLAALDRDPTRRPQSAEAMSDPLRRWLASRGGFDGAALGRLLRERLPPDAEEGFDAASGTVRLADPAAAARHVTIATSVALASLSAPIPEPALTQRETYVPRTSRRLRVAVVAVPIGIAVALAALYIAPGTRPTQAPQTAPFAPVERPPATATPATAAAATVAVIAPPRTAVPMRPGLVKVTAIPWGEVRVDDAPCGAAGCAVFRPTARIEVTGRRGDVARGSAMVQPGKTTICRTDFGADVLFVACDAPR
jgi:eukaryotic-like serine/threonine-protein kinase